MPTAAEYVAALTRTIPDFPRPGIGFEDLTPVLADGAALAAVADALVAPFTGDYDVLAGVEARGFPFAAAAAGPQRPGPPAPAQGRKASGRDPRRGLRAGIRQRPARGPCRPGAGRYSRPPRRRRARDRRNARGGCDGHRACRVECRRALGRARARVPRRAEGGSGRDGCMRCGWFEEGVARPAGFETPPPAAPQPAGGSTSGDRGDAGGPPRRTRSRGRAPHPALRGAARASPLRCPGPSPGGGVAAPPATGIGTRTVVPPGCAMMTSVLAASASGGTCAVTVADPSSRPGDLRGSERR